LVVTIDVNVGRFPEIVAVEVEAVRAISKNCRHVSWSGLAV